MRRTGAIVVLLGVLAAASAPAREFREINPVPTPVAARAALPTGAVPVAHPRAMSRAEVESYVRQVIGAWNTTGLDAHLAPDFHDRERLTDALDTVAPRDAHLRVLSVQGVQTLGQYVQPDAQGGRGKLVTLVSATVRTQLEYNSATGGFKRLDGLNEYVLRITGPAPP